MTYGVKSDITRLLCVLFSSSLVPVQAGHAYAFMSVYANLLFLPLSGTLGRLPLSTVSINNKKRQTDTAQC